MQTNLDLRLEFERVNLKLIGLQIRVLRLRLGLRAYDPDQPRAPAGTSEGGQWIRDLANRVGPARYAQLRPGRRPSSRVINGRIHEVSPTQELRLQLTEARAERLTREVRRYDRSWRREPGLYEGVEGQILANEHVAQQAQARLRTFQRPLPRGVPLTEAMLPGGTSVGRRDGRATERTRTVDTEAFRRLLGDISLDARAVATPRNYEGFWYEQPGDSIFGLRYSDRYGPTIDVIDSNSSYLPKNFKVHVK